MHACMLARPSVCQPAICVHASVCACVHGCVRACVCASIRAPRLIHLDPHPTPLATRPHLAPPHPPHPTLPEQCSGCTACHAFFDRISPGIATQDAKLQADLTGHRSAQLCNVRRRMQDAAGLTGLNCSPTRTHPSSLLRLLVLTQPHRTPPLFLIILLVLVFLC